MRCDCYAYAYTRSARARTTQRPAAAAAADADTGVCHERQRGRTEGGSVATDADDDGRGGATMSRGYTDDGDDLRAGYPGVFLCRFFSVTAEQSLPQFTIL